MPRTCAVVLTLVLVAGTAVAYPGIGGGRGVFRVQNALVQDDAGLTISLHGIGRNPSFGDTAYPDDKGWVGDFIAPELNYAPLATKWAGAEVFGSWGAIVQYPNAAGFEDISWGLHDLKAGAKLSIPIIPVLKLGFMGTYDFLAREDNDGGNWLDPNAVPACDGFGWMGLATLHFQDVAPSAPNVLLNYGEKECGTIYGAAAELVAEGFALFAEARSLQPEGSDGIFDTDSGEIRLTPGVAFGTGTEGSTFKVGYSFGFGAPNEFMLGLVIATPFGKRIPPEYGTIAGKAVDERTGNALAATVEFPENPDMRPVKTDATTGVFTVERVLAGVIVVKVSAEGYHSQAVPINVEGEAVSQYEFKLRPLVTYGVIAGQVLEAETNTPLEATIEFPEAEVAALTSEAATGSFRVDQVPVGVYTVTATAEGYFKGSQTVQVEEGRVAAPVFSLRPLAMKTTITGKISDKKTGDPLAATVSFPNSGLADTQNDPETGVYMAEIPVGSYAVKVTSEGYLAQTAAVVLQKDKPLVKDFELVAEGMSITLRGVYFDFDKATIKPESRPALEDAAKILNENPDIRVEIQGHTDSKGSNEYNQNLSERRAQSVVNFLVTQLSIDRARLVARGYGEVMPIATNDTDEGRALNRRVEFFILESKQK
ncbi:MAG: OmpA family protein [candidate division WOR-3 bacterium]|nr:MAG: OmpA family protein [candidate division WOR-3 bacterium]